MQGLRQSVLAVGVTIGILTAALSGLVAASNEALAASWQTCTYRTGPSSVGYTMEAGTSGGRIPGHAHIAFIHRPYGAWIEGGSYQYWKQDGAYDLYLVNSWPWGHDQAFNLLCYR